MSRRELPSDIRIWNLAPDLETSTESNINLYGPEPSRVNGYYDWDYNDVKFQGRLADGNVTTKVSISYTQQGTKGPIVLYLHGVPTNKMQYSTIQGLTSRFCRTISIDMLGMGKSTMPLRYSKEHDGTSTWIWQNDLPYVDGLMKALYGDEKFFFVADDWGSGICQHYTALFDNTRLHGSVNIDPIAGCGYPVAEIQAIGRAYSLSDEQFQGAMGAFDQTLVQILKTMVHDPSKWNQWSLRRIKYPYASVDYELLGDNAVTSATLPLNFHNIRVLSERASMLAPSNLMPYHRTKNKLGVQFDKITVPQLVLWGAQDNMMPAEQGWRLIHQMFNARVQFTKIENAGHFSGIDQPYVVAEEILKFIMTVGDSGSLAMPCLGFKGIWKGDEEKVIGYLKCIYSKQYRA